MMHIPISCTNVRVLTFVFSGILTEQGTQSKSSSAIVQYIYLFV